MAQLKSTNVLGNLSVTGNILASKFIKLGGTANQILMADGSTLDKSNVGSGTVTSVTVTGNNGLTGTGTITSSGTITLSHADTSSVSNLTAANRTYVKSLTFDAYGHVTGYTTGAETVTNYSLPLAASGTRGGIQIGYTTTENNRAVVLDSEKAYISLPSRLNDYKASTENAPSTSGWYFFNDTTNESAKTAFGSSAQAATWVSAYSNTWAGQLGISYYGDQIAFRRKQNTSTWASWVPIATQSWVNAQGFLTDAITGSGTANYIPKFTAEKTIGNSEIIDNGSNVYPSSNLGNALGHANYVWDRLYVRQIDLNRTKGITYGRINFYSPSFYTWYEYMSNNGVASPTGANTIQYGEVTTWARRSLIENTSGYGWIWEACANGSGTTPIGKMALSSNTGNLITAGSTKSTAFILHSSGTNKATFAYNASDDCVELTFA